MDTVELVMAVEDEFKVVIPNEVAPRLARLRDLHAFVVHALGADGDRVDAEEVWNRLKRLIVDFAAVPEEQVVPDAHVVYDLGLD